MAQNLQIIKGAGVDAAAPIEASGLIKRVFVSHIDGAEDICGFMPPLIVPGTLGYTLVVYLHGMGSTYLEPFIYPKAEQSLANYLCSAHKNVYFLACSYRKSASWGNDTAIADINQNIRAVLQEYPIKKIVLMGTSMGGCTVLNYSTEAPPDIKSKICGIVCVEGAGDLEKLYLQTKTLRMAMSMAFLGKPDQVPDTYRRKSFLAHVDQAPLGARFAVVSAKSDTVVPAQLQRDVVDFLKQKNIPAKLIEIEGAHGIPDAAVYTQAFDWVTSQQP